ncbi:unnamed protein product [Lota lota]
MDIAQEVRRQGLESKMQCINRARHCARPAWATVGIDMTREEMLKGLGRKMRCTDDCERPSWATVGMDITQEEMQKVLGSNVVWEEPRMELLDGLAYGGLVLCLVILLAYLIRKGLKWMRTQSTKIGSQRGSKVGDSVTIEAKMEALEERLAALEQKRLSRRRLTHENTLLDQLD